jgi:hypothetical protein
MDASAKHGPAASQSAAADASEAGARLAEGTLFPARAQS